MVVVQADYGSVGTQPQTAIKKQSATPAGLCHVLEAILGGARTLCSGPGRRRAPSLSLSLFGRDEEREGANSVQRN